MAAQAARAQQAAVDPLAIASIPAVRVGDLATTLEQVPLQPAAATRNWTITPSLGLQEILTDNADTGGRSHRGDAITAITPGVVVDVNTERLVGSLRYMPELQFYALEAHQNTVAQDFGGSGTLTLVPDTLFVDVHAFGTQQSTSGGYAPNGSTNLGNNDRTQTTSFSVAPYLTHRFGGYGTATIGYSFSYTDQSGNSTFAPGATQPYFVSSDLVTNQEYADFRTGEDLGRALDDIRAQATQYSGYGVLSGAHRNTVSNEVEFAISRQFAVLGSVGYEDILYQGVPRTRINDPTWSGGLRYTPNAASTVTLRYGHHDGFNSPSVDASVALTARTTLVASYSDQLGTDETLLQDALAGSATDVNGNPINRVTGAPLLLANQQFGLESSLQRVQALAVGLSTTYARDTFTVNAQQQRQTVRATSVGIAAYSQHGWSVGGTWAHEFGPLTSGIAYLQYGQTTSQLNGTNASSTVTADLAITRRLSPTLVANAQYVFTDRAGAALAGGAAQGVQNAVTVGLLKTF